MKYTFFRYILFFLAVPGHALASNLGPKNNPAEPKKSVQWLLHSIPFAAYIHASPPYIKLNHDLLNTTTKFQNAKDQLNAMKYYIKRGAFCLAKDVDGDTVAHKIIKSSHYSLQEKMNALDFLFEKEPTLVSQVGARKKTVLNLAVEQGDETLTWFLVNDHDAQPVSIKDLDVMVVRSIRRNEEGMTKTLVRSFHEEVFDKHGRTLLHKYAQTGNEEMVRALHRAGAQQTTDACNFTPGKLAFASLKPRSQKFKKIDEILNSDPYECVQEKTQLVADSLAHDAFSVSQPTNNLVNNDNLNLSASPMLGNVPEPVKSKKPLSNFEALHQYAKKHNNGEQWKDMYTDDLAAAIKSIRGIRAELGIQRAFNVPAKKEKLGYAVESSQSEHDFYVKYTQGKTTYEFRAVQGLSEPMICCDAFDGEGHKLELITQVAYTRLCNVIRAGLALSNGGQSEEEFFFVQANEIVRGLEKKAKKEESAQPSELAQNAEQLKSAVKAQPVVPESSLGHDRKDVNKNGIDSIEFMASKQNVYKSRETLPVHSAAHYAINRDDFASAHQAADAHKKVLKKENRQDTNGSTLQVQPAQNRSPSTPVLLSDSELEKEFSEWDSQSSNAVDSVEASASKNIKKNNVGSAVRSIHDYMRGRMLPRELIVHYAMYPSLYAKELKSAFSSEA